MSTAPGLWRHYPWLLGLLLAPLLSGAVNAAGQVVAGTLVAVSLFLLASDYGAYRWPLVKPLWRWLALGLLVWPLVPLPAALAGVLAPQRLAMARAFPVEGSLAWLPLSASPAGTIQRLWELAVIITGFCLARQAAAQPGFGRLFSIVLGAALCLLAASDLATRIGGPIILDGGWRFTKGPGKGTYANYDHFANWLYVASLFALGWCLRNVFPLQSARTQPLSATARHRGDTVFLFGAVLFALVIAVAGGSRAGLGAFLAGLAIWVIFLSHRSKQTRRWFVVGTGLVLILTVLLATGDFLFHRLISSANLSTTLDAKVAIWQEAARMWWGFPWFGAGWGTFVTVFNSLKSGFAGITCWHAENDYVQLLLETGLVGVAVYGMVLGGIFRRVVAYVWQSRLHHPELLFGALAALGAFCLHACFEFVFQITANALLAAALLGYAVGAYEQSRRPTLVTPLLYGRVFGNAAWAGVLLIAAGFQGLACWHDFQAARAPTVLQQVEHYRKAVACWPWDSPRQIALTRAEVRLSDFSARRNLALQRRQAQEIRQRVNRGLAWDPFNWELRLERAWLDLVFSANRDQAITEAWEATRLNPLQPEIPLRFANYLARHDPAQARKFLQAKSLSQEPYLGRALGVAWQMNQDPAVLWSLIPDTVPGLLALGNFALSQRLYPLAIQAFQQLNRRLEPLTLAGKYLEAGRPDLALASLPNSSSPRTRLLAAQAQLQASNWLAAIRLAEQVWLDSPARQQILKGADSRAPLATLRREWQTHPKDPQAAARLAEKLGQIPLPYREVELLRRLAAQFPGEWRLNWLVFQTELALNHPAAAAQTAIQLAGRVVANEQAEMSRLARQH